MLTKLKKKDCISLGVFGHQNEEKYQICVSKNIFKKCVDSLLVGEKDKSHYVLINDFNTFMYGNALRRG